MHQGEQKLLQAALLDQTIREEVGTSPEQGCLLWEA